MKRLATLALGLALCLAAGTARADESARCTVRSIAATNAPGGVERRGSALELAVVQPVKVFVSLAHHVSLVRGGASASPVRSAPVSASTRLRSISCIRLRA